MFHRIIWMQLTVEKNNPMEQQLLLSIVSITISLSFIGVCWRHYRRALRRTDFLIYLWLYMYVSLFEALRPFATCCFLGKTLYHEMFLHHRRHELSIYFSLQRVARYSIEISISKLRLEERSSRYFPADVDCVIGTEMLRRQLGKGLFAWVDRQKRVIFCGVGKLLASSSWAICIYTLIKRFCMYIFWCQYSILTLFAKPSAVFWAVYCRLLSNVSSFRIISSRG